MIEPLQKYENITESIGFSEQKLSELARELNTQNLFGSSIVVNGSYARKEACSHSDLDYFILVPKAVSEINAKRVVKDTKQLVKRIVGNLPSSHTIFGDYRISGTLATNIGGPNDTNDTITQRILFLTEGRCLGKTPPFTEQRNLLIDRYIQRNITEHQLCLFLLNDFIRYWRTLCVDFENKTFEQGKGWALRNIKLSFSRKLLYFSGILIVAETYQRTYLQKKEIAKKLMNLSPAERLFSVCGNHSEKALELYDNFLLAMKDDKFRSKLDSMSSAKRKDEDFRRLKNDAHYFTLQLMSALKATYPEAHPIHRALIL